ncbi:MAG: Gfo/Idh/MocA family oxidoreductase [Bryobacterales bacterium]|nr:Gfo/Idh/MocA family oxidoreductase [Bryobacterales bacterium]
MPPNTSIGPPSAGSSTPRPPRPRRRPRPRRQTRLSTPRRRPLRLPPTPHRRPSSTPSPSSLPASHAELLLAALDSGKHVFVEKPLTSLPDQIPQLIARAESSGRVVAVGHNLRCHRLVRKAKAILHSGALGQLFALRGVWISPTRPRAPWNHDPGIAGSVLMDIGVHHIDLFAFLAGSPIQTAHASLLSSNRDSESAAISGSLANGTLFTTVMARQGLNDHNLHIASSRASIEFSCQRANAFRLTEPHHLGLHAQLAEITQYLSQLPALLVSLRTGGDWLDSYYIQWSEFAAAIHTGSRVPCTIREAAAAVEVCAPLAIRQTGAHA